MKKSIMLVFAAVLLPLFLSGQNFEDAKKLYEKNEYEDALRILNPLYQSNPTDVDVNHYIAKCYMELEVKYTEAIKHLMVVSVDAKAKDYEVLAELGDAYLHEHLFDLSLNYYNQYLKRAKKKEERRLGQHKIEYVLNAQALLKSPVDVSFMNLGKRINSRFNEINPRVSPDESLLFFASNRKDNYDIFLSKRRSNSYWHKAENSGALINTINDEFLAGTSRSFDKIFVHYNENSTAEDVKASVFYKNEFGVLKSLDKTINSIYPEEGTCMSKESDTLYFARNMGANKGGFDLYYTIRLPNGQWGNEQSVGDGVNTEWDENYPMISGDGQKLFFCSKGHNSMGGYDVFVAKKDSTGKFVNPINMGYPINNTHDNLSISMIENERYGYISTHRNDSYGEQDIYKIVFNSIDPIPIVYHGTIQIADETGSRNIIETDSKISITVYDKRKDSVYGIYAYNKITGAYVISLVPGKYEFVVQGDDFQTYRKNILVSEKLYDNNIVDLNIYLQKK